MKTLKIYISTPPQSDGQRTDEDVRKRVEELSVRLKRKFGHDSVSHLDCSQEGKFYDKVGRNVALLLQCDGILIDDKASENRCCNIEKTVAQAMSHWKKPFMFFHTEEEFESVKKKYVV